MKLTKDMLIYGAVTFVAVFFIGWSTGMGGSFWPNLIFSALTGVFATIIFGFITQRMGRKK